MAELSMAEATADPTPPAGGTRILYPKSDGWYDRDDTTISRIGAVNKLDAVVPPTVSNDGTQGYSIGSVWVDTLGQVVYVCASSATGAAVWRVVSNAEIMPTFGEAQPNTNFSNGTAWAKLQPMIQRYVNAGSWSNRTTLSTYSLLYTAATAYAGGVLAPNGDIHFVPLSATMGQKISAAGVVTTYSLVYTVAYAYQGGVLAPNGDIHFVPLSATMGQKISAAGVVTTYSLLYTAATAYAGGVLAPNGDIHFVPRDAAMGQKICTQSPMPLSVGYCTSPYFNKL
jgi:hypothetical protein